MSDEDMVLHNCIRDTLRDAAQYGMGIEVLMWAFRELCKDDRKIMEALDYGFNEWVK